MLASKALHAAADSAKRQLIGIDGEGEPVKRKCLARSLSSGGLDDMRGLSRMPFSKIDFVSSWTEYSVMEPMAAILQ